MTTTTIKRDFLTVRQAADELGVAERTIQHWIASGELQAEPLESGMARTTWIISRKALDDFKKTRGQS